jgi:hypothetical protein
VSVVTTPFSHFRAHSPPELSIQRSSIQQASQGLRDGYRLSSAARLNLGNALQTLGARESGTARLEEAVAAFREALLEQRSNQFASVPHRAKCTEFAWSHSRADLTGEDDADSRRLLDRIGSGLLDGIDRLVAAAWPRRGFGGGGT